MLMFKILGSVRFLKEMYTFMEQGCINKRDSKDFYNVKKYLYFK